jgi:LysR family glycine cleavage system transcriptional activator
VLEVPRLSAIEPWWKQWLTTVGVAEPEEKVPTGFWLDSQVMEGNAALAGHGLAMLMPLFWKSELAAGRLVAPFPIVSLDGFSYWLVYPEHKRNLPKIRAFRAWILEEVAVEARLGPAEVFAPPVAEPA